MEILIAHGGDPLVLDTQNATLAHLGCSKNCSPKLIELLHLHGVNFLARDNSGMTALDVAKKCKASPELINTLVTLSKE